MLRREKKYVHRISEGRKISYRKMMEIFTKYLARFMQAGMPRREASTATMKLLNRSGDIAAASLKSK